MSASPFTLLPLHLLLLGCRPDPGTPAYPDPDPLDSGEDEGLPGGPDPYVEGEARLSYGIFYEGGSSVEIAIDDVERHYYVYSGTYTESEDSQDVVEGRVSTVIEVGSAGWFGGGVHWDAGVDLQDWTTLWVSLRSADAGFADFDLRMVGGVEGGVSVAAYGFAADGAWHHLSVPLADFAAAGVSLGTVTVGFMLLGEGQAAGETLKIDNLYLTAD
jgi:hypothetical protein